MATSDQDDSRPWLRKEFPKLFYICILGYHAGGASHYATWSGISRFGGRRYVPKDGRPTSYREHIRCPALILMADYVEPKLVSPPMKFKVSP